ncbi:MAG: glycosyltransferase [Thermoplasmatota archaeon]
MPGRAAVVGLQRPPSSGSSNFDFSSLTVIVPTLNEAQNLPTLFQALAAQYPGASVLVADDDSSDGTREIAARFSGPLRVTILHRQNCTRGLTASVVEAIKAVQTPFFVVMDADLQHPPESVRAVYAQASNGAHLAVGARQSDNAFSVKRRVVSRGARVLAGSYLRWKGKPVTADPISGFFGGKTAYAQAIIREHEGDFERTGFKVLMDLLRFAPAQTVVHDVPYIFGIRRAGESKLGSKQTFSFLRQLGPIGAAVAKLGEHLALPRFWRFALVGASGAAVNLALLYGLIGLGLPFLMASALAIMGAILCNFIGNEFWSFRGHVEARGRAARLLRYYLQSTLSAAVNFGMVWLLVGAFAAPYWGADMVGIGCGTGVNWLLAINWTWGPGASTVN